MFTVSYGSAPVLFPTEMPTKLYNFYYSVLNYVQIFQNLDNDDDDVWDNHPYLVAVWHIKPKA
jgi:hypothetical protein